MNPIRAPIKNPKHVKKQAHYFMKWSNEFPSTPQSFPFSTRTVVVASQSGLASLPMNPIRAPIKKQKSMSRNTPFVFHKTAHQSPFTPIPLSQYTYSCRGISVRTCIPSNEPHTRTNQENKRVKKQAHGFLPSIFLLFLLHPSPLAR
jgi:hypothetical protein